MARFFSSALGLIKGKLGSVTFFSKDGKSFLKPNKKKHTKSIYNSVPANDNRRKFAQSHYFAKSIKRQKPLVDFWDAMKVKGTSAYFKMHGYNRMRTDRDGLTEFNSITPGGIHIDVNSLVLTKNNISFKFKLSRKFDDYLIPPYNLFVYAYINYGLSSKGIRSIDSFLEIIPVNAEDDGYTEINSKIFNGTSPKHFLQYNNLFIFIAAVKKVKSKEGYEWSSSFFKEFDLKEIF